VTNDGCIFDYGGCDKIKRTPLPMIAIPTAAGTGAEVTPFAVITNRETKWKQPVGGTLNIPPLAICDPELTYSLPPHITAAVGMDALTHAIEGFVSRCVEPMSEGILAKAISLLYHAIRPAVYRGEYDKDARYDMMMGSTLAGIGFITASLGISHCMAHPLGAQYHVPHGVANAICLPVVMEYNYGAWPERFAEIARLFGRDIHGLDTMDAARLAVDCVYELLDDMPIKPLSAWGVTEASLPDLCKDALRGGDRANNPRYTEYEDYERLYKKCLTLKTE
jgi:alcohol dehydrogenase class IV